MIGPVHSYGVSGAFILDFAIIVIVVAVAIVVAYIVTGGRSLRGYDDWS